MKFSLELIRDSDIEPFTLDELKVELRAMTGDTEDAKLARLLTAGRQWFESRTSLALVDQTWRLCLGPNISFYEPAAIERPYGYFYGEIPPQQNIPLLRSPVLGVTSVYSVAADGARTEVDADTYQLRDASSKWPAIVGLSPTIGTNEELQIEFRAGFADRTGSPTQDASVIPAKMTQPIILWVEAMYDRDKDMMEKLLKAAENLADQFSVNLNFS